MGTAALLHWPRRVTSLALGARSRKGDMSVAYLRGENRPGTCGRSLSRGVERRKPNGCEEEEGGLYGREKPEPGGSLLGGFGVPDLDVVKETVFACDA